MKIEDIETLSMGQEEEIIKIGLRRNKKGLLVSVKVHSMIEEMFREWSGGDINPFNSHGRLWSPLEGKKLPPCYALGNMGGHFYTCEGGRYRIDQLGTDLYTGPEVDGRTPWVNMGFLRFIGASKDPITFNVRGVYSVEVIERMRTLITSAAKQVYLDLIKPVDYVVTISTKQIPQEG